MTKEFYNKVADALQLRSENTAVPTWVPDDEGPEAGRYPGQHDLISIWVDFGRVGSVFW